MKDKILASLEKIPEYDKKVKYPEIIVSLSFLTIHIVMFIVFLTHQVMPMAYFNIFSILFYISTFILIKKEKEKLFVVSVFAEVLVHMFLAIIFVGWGAGFQVTLIGITIMVFYAEYAGRVIKINHVNGISMSIVIMVVYLLAYIITTAYPPAYKFPEITEFWLQILWGIITFVIVIMFLEIFVLITSRSEKNLSEQVAHDELTGLFSRHFMSEYLERIMNENTKSRYWIAMADIDDFKKVNDTYGHNCGDYVLKTLAELIRTELHHTEVCRWGGEEFLMVGENRSGMEEESSGLDRIRRIISEFGFDYEGQQLKITITIGIACYDESYTRDEWINKADECLYIGKNSGKNQVVTG